MSRILSPFPPMSVRMVLATLYSAAVLSSCSSRSDVTAVQCHPCTVSVRVGPLLKDAQQMFAAKDYEGARAKLDAAEAVKFNPDDETVINQFRRAIAVASSRSSQP